MATKRVITPPKLTRDIDRLLMLANDPLFFYRMTMVSKLSPARTTVRGTLGHFGPGNPHADPDIRCLREGASLTPSRHGLTFDRRLIMRTLCSGDTSGRRLTSLESASNLIRNGIQFGPGHDVMVVVFYLDSRCPDVPQWFARGSGVVKW